MLASPDMSDPLPVFLYHPNPMATGAVEEKDTACGCCGESNGFIYVGPVYSVRELHNSICPWCIANGSAARTLEASFTDDSPLIKAGLDSAIVEEVSLRTPGYTAWQQEAWLSHCHDACEFQGYATVSDVRTASRETKQHWMREYNLDEETWLAITEGYRPGGDSAVYKFKCRHCQLVLFGWDVS